MSIPRTRNFHHGLLTYSVPETFQKKDSPHTPTASRYPATLLANDVHMVSLEPVVRKYYRPDLHHLPLHWPLQRTV